MPSTLPDIRFSAAQPEDFEALLALRIEAMRESLTRIGRFDPARARARLLAGFSPADTRHIEHEGQRVGFVVTKALRDCLLLDHLYLLPAHQGRGIGHAVMTQVLDEAAALNLPVRVCALRESAANRFYLAHGFQLIEQAEFDNTYLRPLPATPHPI